MCDLVTYCDVYDCNDCPRMGDDCDGNFIEPLERVGVSRATPVKDCLYPKCEECDNYHGHYCTVPMVISKQIYRYAQEKMRSMEQRLDWLEKAVTDEILGDREDEDEEIYLPTKEEYDAMTPVQKFWFDKSLSEGLKTIPHSTSSDKGKSVEIRKYSILKRDDK